MKNLATRVLALIVALTVLFASSALADEQNMAVLSIGNFDFTMDGETLYLPVTLQLGGGADVEGGRGMALLSLLVGDEVAGSAYGALEDEQIKVLVDGMDYGLYLTLEDALALLEAEAGMSMEDLMSAAGAEVGPLLTDLETSLNDLFTAAAALEAAEAEMDLIALMEAMSITLNDAGTSSVEAFGETVTASKLTLDVEPHTMQEFVDAMCEAIPGYAEYWAVYSDLLNESMAQTGEEVDMNEALSMVSIAAKGAVYTNETDTIADLVLTISAEGESIELPFFTALRETETTVTSELYMEMTVDSETLYFSGLGVETDNETDYSLSLSAAMGMLDNESGESEGALAFAFDVADTEEGVYLGVSFNFDDGYDPVAASIEYAGTHAYTEDAATFWDGALGLYALVEGSEMELLMDTSLMLDTMPEGELITLGDSSINLAEADDAAMEQFMADAQVPLMQLLGTLMQNETIAALLGDLM